MLIRYETCMEVVESRPEVSAVWLRDAMQDGMALLINPVPVEVEVTAARTWGG